MEDEPTRPQQSNRQQPTGERTVRRVRPASAEPYTRRGKPRPRRRRFRFWGCVRTVLAIAAMLFAALLGAGFVAGLVLYNSLAGELAEDLATLESMEGVEDFETTRIYDRTGEVLLYEIFGEGRRTEIPLDRVPFALRWATVATEDDTFYENPGFDPPSIARAAWWWYREGEIISGGSTITQQLVRQIVFDYEERVEQTLRRKLKEAALAWVMTQQYSKDEILELYLNEVYYGNLAYGIEEASNVYFGKPASDLTVAEAAFLAGLPQSPVAYDPYTDFGAAKARQRQVLDLMARHGYLTLEEADAAFNEPPLVLADLASPDVSLLAPHFTVEVRRQLSEVPGVEPDMIARGGLIITTTLDMQMQELGETTVAAQIEEFGAQYDMSNAALVAVDPNSGDVLAMVGSVDYDDEAIDGAVNNILSPHQPGSTMKPLTYAAAFEQGWTAADVLWDVPMVYDTGVGDYEPRNYDERFHGPVRLRDALANSYNIPAVTLAREVGVDHILEISERFGITSLGRDASFYGLSLTLGGGEVTPLEMAGAFGVFANGGQRVPQRVILRVEDNDGNLIYEAPEAPGEDALDERVAFLISSILSDNAARTPAMRAESPLLLDFPAAAKTGTTNDYRDNWTIGYTPHLVVAVWAGNTNDEPMAEGTSGLTGAAPIWHDYMTAVYQLPGIAARLEKPGLPPLRSDFTPPERVEQRPVCVLSALQDPASAEEGCPQEAQEWFRVGGTDPAIPPTATPSPTPVPTLADAEPGDEPLLPTRVDAGIDVWGIRVLPLDDEERRGQVVETLRAAWDSLPDDAPQPAPPIYCEVVQPIVDAEDVEDVRFQLFIAAPEGAIDAIRARNWAYENGVPIEPGAGCPAELIEEITEPEEFANPLGATYAITEPDDGAEVYGVLPVEGTAIWDPERVLYYKVEIGQGESPTEWLTLGETHNEPVEDGRLEVLHADALEPGPYQLRLVLVQVDGNFLTPYTIPITVIPTPEPTPAG